ncbi:MAG: acylphosphatase [Deltaproteobacteria bacterium]|nr:acylphosphatase [Deltaproteobacteria bacterium]
MMAGRRIAIRGTVQGVGFRPWVYRLARRTGIVGRVRNDPRGVTIEAFGDESSLNRFVQQLEIDVPSSARIVDLETVPMPHEDLDEFRIESSGATGDKALSIPPDLSTCADCECEIRDPSNRRYGYAFTNCTTCGPRFTIATGIPYDRAATTMSSFEMCAACQDEYDRTHAQTVVRRWSSSH